MTCLEHLIENCLCKFEDGKPYEEIEKAIKNDINLADSGITAEQCFEICLYVWGAFLPYGGYKKINDGDIIIHKDEKERTDEEIKWLVEHNAEGSEAHEKYLMDIGYAIITKEEYEKLKDLEKNFDYNLVQERKAIRKETAREILQTLYDQCYEYNPRLPEESIGHIIPINILTLAKQYGVEVEE